MDNARYLFQDCDAGCRGAATATRGTGAAAGFEDVEVWQMLCDNTQSHFFYVENRLFKAARIARLVLVFAALCLAACAPVETRPLECGEKALAAALVFGRDYPVRVAYGPREIYGQKGMHAQAQACIRGVWTPVSVFADEANTGAHDEGFLIEEYMAPGLLFRILSGEAVPRVKRAVPLPD